MCVKLKGKFTITDIYVFTCIDVDAYCFCPSNYKLFFFRQQKMQEVCIGYGDQTNR